ncbi:MAG: hypothetical protein DRP08_05005 [Candidatus Aenigmatarchaeota archaeon]|nr:MAG: hypothetical protein DRP08_05005 [Candidatus Aenigmarchaeota archaeon]
MKVEIPDRDAAVMYFAILQNLAQRPDLTDLERQALDFASSLLYQSIYSEEISEIGEGEESGREKEIQRDVEKVRSVHELAQVRRVNAKQ